MTVEEYERLTLGRMQSKRWRTTPEGVPKIWHDDVPMAGGIEVEICRKANRKLWIVAKSPCSRCGVRHGEMRVPFVYVEEIPDDGARV